MWCYYPRHDLRIFTLNGYVLDGSSCCVSGRRTLRIYIVENTTKRGITLKTLTDQADEIFYICEPLLESTHDITVRNWFIRSHTTLASHRRQRLRGFRMRHTEEETWQTPARMAENIQQGNQPDLVCDQTIHRPHEGIADPGNPLQAPLNHNYSGNQRDAKNNVLPTTT